MVDIASWPLDLSCCHGLYSYVGSFLALIWRSLEIFFGYECLVHLFACFHSPQAGEVETRFIVDYLLRERGGSGRNGIQYFRDSGFRFIALGSLSILRVLGHQRLGWKGRVVRLESHRSLS